MDERYDAEALRLARQAVMAGESVLWAGRPGRKWVPGLLASKPALVLVMVVGALAWRLREEPGILTRNWDTIGLALLILTIPAVVGLALGVRELRRRNREIYAVTARRVLILRADGTVRDAVGLERVGDFRRVGRDLWLGDVDEAYRQGKGDLDGGMRRFEQLPRLERLADAERVMAVIKAAAPKASGAI